MILISVSSWSQLQGPSLTADKEIAQVKTTSSQDGNHFIGVTPLAAFMDLIHTKLIYMSLKVKHSPKVSIPKSITCLCSMSSIRSGVPKGSSTLLPSHQELWKDRNHTHQAIQTPTEPTPGLCKYFFDEDSILNPCYSLRILLQEEKSSEN